MSRTHARDAFLAQAVAYLAEQPGGGIVHRDLKLTNVFLTGRKHHRDGTIGRPRVKLGDFGIAACARDLAAAATGKGGGAGTAQYASPEALAGAACTPASVRAARVQAGSLMTPAAKRARSTSSST